MAKDSIKFMSYNVDLWHYYLLIAILLGDDNSKFIGNFSIYQMSANDWKGIKYCWNMISHIKQHFDSKDL